ncbi:MAG: cobalamin-dependent protein [Verrucomicrobiia bacterium]|jgi:methylmalonyl-CoA mutase cobalamin-binding domain/chain
MNISTWSNRLLDTMVKADRAGAADLVAQVLANGLPSNRVLAEVLDPALVRVGQLWEQEQASLAQTFVAAKIAEDVLLRCLPEAGEASSHPPKGRVVIGNIEDDFHSLGRRIVASFLQAAGWEVHDLGNDVVAELFVDKAIEINAAVVGASAMTHTTALNIRKLRTVIDARGLAGQIKLAVGGAVFNWRPDLVAEVGGDGTAHNAAAADALCARLQAETVRNAGSQATKEPTR